ncbi:MAG: hypothetical protein ACKVP3_25410 [Hyphomicrobiaceae bacterium]
MAKGEQRSNREKRKPKAVKAKPAAGGAASPFAPAPGMNKGNAGGKKR